MNCSNTSVTRTLNCELFVNKSASKCIFKHLVAENLNITLVDLCVPAHYNIHMCFGSVREISILGGLFALSGVVPAWVRFRSEVLDEYL